MNCKEGAVLLIDQIIDTIQLIPGDSYSKPLDIFNQSTFGKHFRHIYDFFFCLSNQCQYKEVDYAARNRESKIESDREYVIKSFASIKDLIGKLNEDEEISVYADFELSDGDRPKVKTTIGRELMYAYDHAVHHLAIIKIGLKSLDPSIPIDETLGVAASTTQHHYELAHDH